MNLLLIKKGIEGLKLGRVVILKKKNLGFKINGFNIIKRIVVIQLEMDGKSDIIFHFI